MSAIKHSGYRSEALNNCPVWMHHSTNMTILALICKADTYQGALAAATLEAAAD